jgi:DNA-binding NarL/FixJ family response regulator
MSRARLFIIDPSRALIEAIHRFVHESPVLHVIGGALHTEAALPQIVRAHPDVVLIDLVHADRDTLQFIGTLKRMPLAPQVVVMSLYDAPPYQRAARAAGADAFVSKAELITQLEPLIAGLPIPSLGGNDQAYANRVAHQAGDVVDVQPLHQ